MVNQNLLLRQHHSHIDTAARNVGFVYQLVHERKTERKFAGVVICGAWGHQSGTIDANILLIPVLTARGDGGLFKWASMRNHQPAPVISSESPDRGHSNYSSVLLSTSFYVSQIQAGGQMTAHLLCLLNGLATLA